MPDRAIMGRFEQQRFHFIVDVDNRLSNDEHHVAQIGRVDGSMADRGE